MPREMECLGGQDQLHGQGSSSEGLSSHWCVLLLTSFFIYLICPYIIFHIFNCKLAFPPSHHPVALAGVQRGAEKLFN